MKLKNYTNQVGNHGAGRRFALLCLVLCSLSNMIFSHPADAEENASVNEPASAPAVKTTVSESGDTQRDFYQVLDDLLVEFEADLSQRRVKGLENMAIRKIDLSENLPSSFSLHLEYMLTERILKRNTTKIINCIPCKSKKSFVEDDRLTITSNVSNIKELDKIAQSLEIENFLDVTFLYNPGSMILSMSVFNVNTRNIVWSKTYNSETIRTSYVRKGFDVKDVEDARTVDFYRPRFKFYAGLNQTFLPVSGGSPEGTSGLHLRLMERFNDNRQEFGFFVGYGMSTKILFKQAKASGSATEKEKALFNMYTQVLNPGFRYQYNFIPPMESYNVLRTSFYIGGGALMGTGYFTGEIHSGLQLFLGKTWFVNTGLQFLLTSVLRNAAGNTISDAKSGGIGFHGIVGWVL